MYLKFTVRTQEETIESVVQSTMEDGAIVAWRLACLSHNEPIGFRVVSDTSLAITNSKGDRLCTIHWEPISVLSAVELDELVNSMIRSNRPQELR